MENDRLKFRVYCEALVNGEVVRCVESEASWFALTQAGNLLEAAPCMPYTEPYGYQVLKPLMCTGLKDKNGQLIYEGDIVEYKIPGVPILAGVVEYNISSTSYLKGGQALSTYQKSSVVIGNIYENPELLERCKPNTFS